MLAKDEPAFKLMGASVCELFGYLTGYDWTVVVRAQCTSVCRT